MGSRTFSSESSSREVPAVAPEDTRGAGDFKMPWPYASTSLALSLPGIMLPFSACFCWFPVSLATVEGISAK